MEGDQGSAQAPVCEFERLVIDSEENNEDLNLDTPDGFRQSVKRKIKKLMCASGRSDDEGASSSGDAGPRHPSTGSSDFGEARTALVASEMQGAQQGRREEDSDQYDFTHPKRGVAIIINNEDFSSTADFDDRPGSSYDAAALYHSFRGLGFDVFPYKDLPAWKMVEVLKAAASGYDHENADCLVCAILSHGDETLSDREWERRGKKMRVDLLFGVDGRAVGTKYIIELFSDANCPKLNGKPRLFFLQACRGTKLDPGQKIRVTRERFTAGIRPVRHGDDKDSGEKQARGEIDQPDLAHSTHEGSSVDPPHFTDEVIDTTDAKPLSQEDFEDDDDAQGGEEDRLDALGGGVREIPVSPAPLFKDFLVMYATPPGFFAWRRTTGAWFVQSLCKVIDSDIVKRRSFINVLSIVCGLVARNYQSQNPSKPKMHDKKTVPVIESMLVKDIIFTKKHRH